LDALSDVLDRSHLFQPDQLADAVGLAVSRLGITELRNTEGDMFGVRRLIDHTERHAAAGLPAAETLHRLAHAVATHHDGPAADDATLLLAQWSPAAAQRALP
jgi:hypothetical protein